MQAIFIPYKDKEDGFVQVLGAITILVLLVGVATTTYLSQTIQDLRGKAAYPLQTTESNRLFSNVDNDVEIARRLKEQQEKDEQVKKELEEDKRKQELAEQQRQEIARKQRESDAQKAWEEKQKQDAEQQKAADELADQQALLAKKAAADAAAQAELDRQAAIDAAKQQQDEYAAEQKRLADAEQARRQQEEADKVKAQEEQERKDQEELRRWSILLAEQQKAADELAAQQALLAKKAAADAAAQAELDRQAAIDAAKQQQDEYAAEQKRLAVIAAAEEQQKDFQQELDKQTADAAAKAAQDEIDKAIKARTDAIAAKLDREEKAADELTAQKTQQKTVLQAEEDKQNSTEADIVAKIEDEETIRRNAIAADNARRQQEESDRQKQQEDEAEKQRKQVLADANIKKLVAEADRKATEKVTTSGTTQYTEPNEDGLSFPIVDSTTQIPNNTSPSTAKNIDWSFVTAGRGDLGQKLSANLSHVFNPDESRSDYGSRALALTDTLLLGSLSNYLLTNIEQNAKGAAWNDPERLKAAALLGGTAVTEFGAGGAALAYGLPAVGVGTAPSLSTSVLPVLSDAALGAYVQGSIALANAPPVVQTAIQLAGPAGMALTAYECSQGNQEACATGFAMGSQHLGELAVSGAESVVKNVQKAPNSEKFEQVINQVDDFITYKMGPDATNGSLQPRVMGCRAGLCGNQAASGEVARIAEDAGFSTGIYDVRDVQRLSGSNPSDSFRHKFNVVDVGEDQKYLVDLTFTQFMDDTTGTIKDEVVNTGVSVNNALAQQLLDKGYAPLTSENLAEYLRITSGKYTGPGNVDIGIFGKARNTEPIEYILSDLKDPDRYARTFKGGLNSIEKAAVELEINLPFSGSSTKKLGDEVLETSWATQLNNDIKVIEKQGVPVITNNQLRTNRGAVYSFDPDSIQNPKGTIKLGDIQQESVRDVVAKVEHEARHFIYNESADFTPYTQVRVVAEEYANYSIMANTDYLSPEMRQHAQTMVDQIDFVASQNQLSSVDKTKVMLRVVSSSEEQWQKLLTLPFK